MRTAGRTHLFVALALVLVLPALCLADTLNVGPGQTYTTIQAAINAASAGDTIVVAGGTYNENLIVNKQLTLMGDGSHPLISCNVGKYDAGISIRADGVVVQGLEITNATSDLGYIVTDKDRYSANWTVDDCIIHDVRSGVLAYGPNVTVTDCHLYSIHGGQARMYGSGPCTVTGNWIHGRQSVSDRGDYGVELSENRCNSGDTIVADNYIAGMRVGIGFLPGYDHAASGGTLTIAHNTLDGSTDVWGSDTYSTMGISFWSGGGNAYDVSKIAVRDNIFNRALWYGLYNGDDGTTGGLSGDLPVENCLFSDNYWYYWPDYQYDEQWFGTEAAAQAGWTSTGGDFTFDTSFTADPLFALDQTNWDPSEYYALLSGSPALNAATDGTNIGAWQGAPAGPTGDDSPEPATWVLLACTGIAGAIRSRRRNK